MLKQIALSSILALVLSLALDSGAMATTGDVACSGGGTYHVANNVVDTSSNCTGDVVFADSITEIGNEAFANYTQNYIAQTAITSITFGGSLTRIGNFAFNGSIANLTDLNIPNSVVSIGECAFFNAGHLNNLTLGDHVLSIGDAAFANSGYLQGVSLPHSLNFVGRNAFDSSGLRSLRIPSSLTNIGPRAFLGLASLSDLYIEDGVTSIGANSFAASDSLLTIRFPETLQVIGVGAFAEDFSIQTLVLPNSLTTIDSDAFLYADGITSIYIGTGLTSIEVEVFSANPTCLTNNSLGISFLDLLDAGIPVPLPECPALVQSPSPQPTQTATPTPTPTPNPTTQPRAEVAENDKPAIFGRSSRTADQKGGSVFKISGNRLLEVVAVFMDGSTMQIQSATENEICLRLPAHSPGYVDLILKTSAGSIIYQDAFEYITVKATTTTSPGPIPAITVKKILKKKSKKAARR